MKEFKDYQTITKQRKTSPLRTLDFNLTRLIEAAIIRLGVWKGKYRGKEKVIFNIGSGYTTYSNCVQCDLLPSLSKLVLGRAKLPDNIMNLYFHQKSFDNKASGIYLSHVLEHIDILAVENILGITLHYLTPGAHIRILVPDFKVYTREHSRGEVTPQGFVSQTLSLNRLFYHWGHIFMYDLQILEDLLLNVGYVNVKHVQCGDGPLGQFDSKERQYESLCVIAEKP